MEVSVKTNETGFKPFTLTIQVDTPEEAKRVHDFIAALNPSLEASPVFGAVWDASKGRAVSIKGEV